MNLVGKILIVLIFVMCIMFMVSSVMVFATHQNFKQKFTASQQQLTQIQGENSALQGEKDRLERQLAMERAARQQAIAAAESDLLRRTQELTAKEAELNQLQDNTRQLTAVVQASAQTVEGLQKQVDAQKAEIISLREDQRGKFDQVVQVTDENNQLEGTLQRVEAQSRQLRDALGVAQQALDYVGAPATAPVTGTAPRAEGRVLEVRGDRVVVSLGKDDGIRAGHELDISRGERYLGRILITKTITDKAVGEVMDGFRRGPIQRDDRVRTQVR
jgi:hypothetical protein